MSDFENYEEMPLLDDDQLEMLIFDGEDSSADLIKELLELFKEESQDILKSLEGALVAKEFSEIKGLSHSLAGSSSNVGGKRLWGICKHIEESVESPTDREGLPSINRVKTIYDETLEGIQGRIREIEG